MQSAYHPYHSTETALNHTLNDVYQSIHHGEPTLLISLDLGAAYDTTDHSSQLSRINTSFGVSETALSWLASYLSGRSHDVRIGSVSSPTTNCVLGVPQGSVLGPILFSIFVSPVGHLASSHQVKHQQYADDSYTLLFLLRSLSSASIPCSTACILFMLGFLLTVSHSICPNLTPFFSLLVNVGSHLRLSHMLTSLVYGGQVV